MLNKLVISSFMAVYADGPYSFCPKRSRQRPTQWHDSRSERCHHSRGKSHAVQSRHNFSREFTTGDNGLYTFTLIPPGNYQLKVEKTGFTACASNQHRLWPSASPQRLIRRLSVGNVHRNRRSDSRGAGPEYRQCGPWF